MCLEIATNFHDQWVILGGRERIIRTPELNLVRALNQHPLDNTYLHISQATTRARWEASTILCSAGWSPCRAD